MSNPRVDRLVTFVAILVLVLSGALCLLAKPAPVQLATSTTASDETSAGTASSTHPTIVWTPTSVNQTVNTGATTTVEVSFTASTEIDGATMRVVPSLQQFVRIAPASINTVYAGQATKATVTIEVPALTLPQAIDGTIQLRYASGAGNTIAQPLPVNLNIIWSTYADNTLGFSLQYPSSFIPVKSADPAWKQVSFAENLAALNAGIDPVLRINILPLASGQSVQDWIDGFGVNDSNISSVTLGGHTYLAWSDATDEPGTVLSYSTSFPGGQVLTITAQSEALATSPAFQQIATSLTF